MARERSIERSGRDRGARLGVWVLKLWPTRAGLPDRLLLASPGRVVLVEVKTATGRVSVIQKRTFARLAELGFPVRIVRSTREFKALLKELDR